MSFLQTSTQSLAVAARTCRDHALQLLYPPACLACRTSLDDPTSVDFCASCLEGFDVFTAPFCRGCGRTVPVPLAENQICGHCGSQKPRFDRAYSLGPYDGLLRDLLLRAKHPAGEVAAIALGQLLFEVRGEEVANLNVDVVCPVPMHWRRRALRLTNSAVRVAEVLARRLKVPLAEGLLVRRRATQPQSSLPPTRRLENVRRAFALGGGFRLEAAHVLLVDDILTTGATCNEAARVLRRSGAAQVSVAVVARSFSGR